MVISLSGIPPSVTSASDVEIRGERWNFNCPHSDLSSVTHLFSPDTAVIEPLTAIAERGGYASTRPCLTTTTDVQPRWATL